MKNGSQETRSRRVSVGWQNEQPAENAGWTDEERVTQDAARESRRSRRVLVVDDEKQMRDLLATAVRKTGLACDVACDGTETMGQLERQVYDVAVVDMVLPDVSGLEIISRIRRQDSATRVVVITGHGDVKSAAEAVRAQADDYILKPFKMAEFMASLGRSLDRQEAFRQACLTQEQLTQQIAQLQQDLETRSTGGIMALAKALEARDAYTKGHCLRVANMSLRLAGELGFTGDQIDEVGIGALLHDVGKIAVPDNILLKAGRLTHEEYENVKQHPRLGYDILLPFFGLGIVTECALYHHERWDGGGYPEGLVGEKCPLPGRILTISDAFDAMTSARPYRAAFSESEALEEIEINRGKHFDPQIADLFCEIRPDLFTQEEPGMLS